MKLRIYKNFIITGVLVLSFFVLLPVSFADTMGDTRTFSVNSKYDKFSRTVVNATLRQVSGHAYFYVEDRYWNNLSSNGKTILGNNIVALGQEFDTNIYPTEIQFWGSEPNPGIDNDSRATILFEDLISSNGGYFDTANQYLKNMADNSNEREMVFLNVEALNGNSAKIFLGHEFQHLISFNQKEVIRRIQEDVWFNELRSEYVASLLGYNNNFYSSNLEKRVAIFTDDPSDSLTEWPNVSTDYAQVVLFGEYLTEQYGPAILSETLQSYYAGIDSINQYFQGHGLPEKFSNVFENWTVTNYLNNSFSDKRYGYTRDELKNIHVLPVQNFAFYPTTLSLSYSLKPWQSVWYKYNFNSLPSDKAIKIDYNSNYLFKVLYADNLGRVGVLNSPGYISNPGGLSSVVLMPINESKTSGFGTSEVSQTLSVNISYTDNALAQPIIDGSLIKRPGESEMYVVEGKYKRYLRSEIIKLYGQLDPSKAIELDDKTFNSYTTANYARYVNDKKVYAVWPDGTKHWLKITPQQWDASGRDWGAIFVVNDLEFNAYKTGVNITN